MNRKERVEKIFEAQDLINEAIELIEDAISGTANEMNTTAYILDHLRIIVSDDHGFCTSSKNLSDVIEELNKGE
jgi:hypothetical protein